MKTLLIFTLVAFVVGGALLHMGVGVPVVVGISLLVALLATVGGLAAAAATTIGVLLGVVGLVVGIVALVVALPVIIPLLILAAPLLLIAAVIGGLVSICT